MDNDLLWDDFVGRTMTNEYGYFEVVFGQENFAKLLALEGKPDLCVIVNDAEGNRLYQTPPGEIRRDADSFEYFHITLPTN